MKVRHNDDNEESLEDMHIGIISSSTERDSNKVGLSIVFVCSTQRILKLLTLLPRIKTTAINVEIIMTLHT